MAERLDNPIKILKFWKKIFLAGLMQNLSRIKNLETELKIVSFIKSY